MNPQRNSSARWRKIFLLSVCSLPALCAFYMMWTHWLPGPLWDEWGTPGAQLASYYRGTLSFAELFSQHNESRKFFPRLLYLPISIAAGWDMRPYMVLTFALVCGGSASIYQLVRQTSGFSPLGSLCFRRDEFPALFAAAIRKFSLWNTGRAFCSGCRADSCHPDESLGSIVQVEDARECSVGVSQYLHVREWDAHMASGISSRDSGGPWSPRGAHADLLASGLHLNGDGIHRFVFHFVSTSTDRTARRVAVRAAGGVPALCSRLDWIFVQRGRARDLRRRRPFSLRRPRGRSHLADATHGSVAIALSLARFGFLHGDLGLRHCDGAAGIRLLDGGRRALYCILRVPLHRGLGARIQRLFGDETASAHFAHRASRCRHFLCAHSHTLGDHIQKGAPPVADPHSRAGTFTARAAMERGDSAKS